MDESSPKTNIPEYGSTPHKPRSRVKLVLVLVAAIILIPPIICVGIVVFFARPVRIAGQTMSPILKNGDRILLWKRFSSLERGDIVVFYYPGDTSKSFIKRIVGLPGEKIGVDD